MNNSKDCIEDYIAQQSQEIQPLLKEIRDTIHKVLPNSEERISWKMPTYWEGHNIIHFAAFKNHIGLYPGPEAIIHFKNDLIEFKTTKGAIQFPYDKEIPFDLIKDITKWCYVTGNHH